MILMKKLSAVRQKSCACLMICRFPDDGNTRSERPPYDSNLGIVIPDLPSFVNIEYGLDSSAAQICVTIPKTDSAMRVGVTQNVGSFEAVRKHKRFIIKKIGGTTVRHDPAGIDYNHTRADLDRQLQVMGSNDSGMIK